MPVFFQCVYSKQVPISPNTFTLLLILCDCCAGRLPSSLEAREAALLERISALTDELDAARDEGSRLREQLQAVQQRCEGAGFKMNPTDFK